MAKRGGGKPEGGGAYPGKKGAFDGISGSGESFAGGGREKGFYGGGPVGNKPDGSDYADRSVFDGGDGNLNQRGLDLDKGDFRKDFQGRKDYQKGRPTKSVERVPELGDRGIPPGIPNLGANRMRGPVVDPAGDASRGIPPMNANPNSIGISVSGVKTKDPHP